LKKEEVKMKKLFILLLLLGVASSALADTVDWWDLYTPAPGYASRDRDWFNPANWVWGLNTSPPPGVPTVAREVRTHRTLGAPYDLTPIIATGSPYDASGNAFASVINIGGTAAALGGLPHGQLTINSGSLTVPNGLRVGGGSGSIRSGEFYVNGGVVNASNYLAVGYGPAAGGNSGWMYMTDGTINAGQFDIGRVNGTNPINGYAYISGGTINATDFRMKPAGGTGTVSLDISGTGKIIINGDKTAAIYGYIDSGWIKTNGVAWDNYDWVTYDGTKTTIIPEPATICLLGIGALSLLRRRK
jgi:hypothetical protein